MKNTALCPSSSASTRFRSNGNARGTRGPSGWTIAKYVTGSVGRIVVLVKIKPKTQTTRQTSSAKPKTNQTKTASTMHCSLFACKIPPLVKRKQTKWWTRFESRAISIMTNYKLSYLVATRTISVGHGESTALGPGSNPSCPTVEQKCA